MQFQPKPSCLRVKVSKAVKSCQFEIRKCPYLSLLPKSLTSLFRPPLTSYRLAATRSPLIPHALVFSNSALALVTAIQCYLALPFLSALPCLPVPFCTSVLLSTLHSGFETPLRAQAFILCRAGGHHPLTSAQAQILSSPFPLSPLHFSRAQTHCLALVELTLSALPSDTYPPPCTKLLSSTVPLGFYTAPGARKKTFPFAPKLFPFASCSGS